MCQRQARTPSPWLWSRSHNPAGRHLATLAARVQPTSHPHPGPDPPQNICLPTPDCAFRGFSCPESAVVLALGSLCWDSVHPHPQPVKPPWGDDHCCGVQPAASGWGLPACFPRVPLVLLAMRVSNAAPVQSTESCPEGFMLILYLQHLPNDSHSCNCHPSCKISLLLHDLPYSLSYLDLLASESSLQSLWHWKQHTKCQVFLLLFPDLLTATPPPRHLQELVPSYCIDLHCEISTEENPTC